MVNRGGDAQPTRRIGEVWALLAGALVILALAPALMRSLATAAEWLPYPYPRAGSEGLILYESLMVARGEDIYAPITPERFISGPYPPLYYWIAALTLPDALPAFSMPGMVESVFTPGRMISLIAALVAAGTIPFLVFFSYRGRNARVALLSGAVGGVVFLTLPQTVVWAARFRGDMLMIAFTALGLLCIAWGTRGEERGRGFWTILGLGAVFFALAFYTKQTALAGPMAAGAYLLLRDVRLGLKWCAVMLAVVAVPFVVLEISTGHWFYLKMVEYHSLPLRGSTLARLLEFAWWEDSWPLIVTGAGFLAYTAARWVGLVGGSDKGERRKFAPPLTALFLGAALLTLPTGAVIGADHNHLLVPGLAVAVSVGAAGALLGSGLSGGRAGGWGIAAGGAYAALVVVYGLVTAPPSLWYDADLTLPSGAFQEQYRQIIENVRADPGELYFSDHPGIAALAGKRTNYDDPFTMTALALGGRWDEGYFRQMLSEGKFSLIVLACNVIEAPEGCRADTLSPGVIEAIEEGYRLLFRDVLFTYAPK